MAPRFPHALRHVLIFLLILAAPATSAAGQESPDAVRVMSFNIRYGTASDGEDVWPNRRDLVLDVIADFGPTVLGIQEALDFQVEALEDALPRTRVVGVGRDDGVAAGEWSAILVDTARVEVEDEGTFWFSDTPEVPGSMSWGNRITRICTWARLRDRETGGVFYVYNNHWDHESQPSRERSAELLLRRIAGAEDPEASVLVLGDFNAGEDNPAFRSLAAGTGLRDAFRAVHPDAVDVGTFNGFEGRADGEKIDAILVSDGWCVEGASIDRTSRDGRYPSDHFPVTAVVRPAGPAGPRGACRRP